VYAEPLIYACVYHIVLCRMNFDMAVVECRLKCRCRYSAVHGYHFEDLITRIYVTLGTL